MEHWAKHKTSCRIWRALDARVVGQRKYSVYEVAAAVAAVAARCNAAASPAEAEAIAAGLVDSEGNKTSPANASPGAPVSEAAAAAGMGAVAQALRANPAFVRELRAHKEVFAALALEQEQANGGGGGGGGRSASNGAAGGPRLATRNRGDDDDLVVSDEPVNVVLTCPMSLARIKVPVRGSQCKHVACMDLSSFLTFANNVSQCHFCNRTVLVDELAVSERVHIALRSYPESVSLVRAFGPGPYMAYDQATGAPIPPSQTAAVAAIGGVEQASEIAIVLALLARTVAELNTAATNLATAIAAAEAETAAKAKAKAKADAAAAKAGSGGAAAAAAADSDDDSVMCLSDDDDQAPPPPPAKKAATATAAAADAVTAKTEVQLPAPAGQQQQQPQQQSQQQQQQQQQQQARAVSAATTAAAPATTAARTASASAAPAAAPVFGAGTDAEPIELD